jgi:DNA endonuclease I-HmuI-like, NUMOD-like domain
MKERIEKIKDHLKEYRAVYISGAVGIVIGGVGVYILTKKGGSNQITDSYKLQWKPTTTNNVTTILMRLGHPGNMVRCIETGEVFASQNRAAKVMGIKASNLCSHLNGRHPHAGGYHFERIGEAS